MEKYHERRDYRKNLTSSGELFFGGERLEIKSYDVSLRGIMIEVFPGKILTNIEDINKILQNHDIAEIFVEELKLSGEAKVVWAKEDNQRMLMGLEFKDVHYNAQKLWVKRASYRQEKTFPCTLLLEHDQVEVQGINISISGLALTGHLKPYALQEGDVVKLQLTGVAVYQALGKIIWINENSETSITMGLQYIELG